MASKPRLLDLFCGAGGAAMGYSRAGFEVVGVDIKPQPHYPFEFYQVDALDVLRCWNRTRYTALMDEGFAAIHASPPCQDHSSLASITGGNGTGWLLDATLKLLQDTGLSWVVENVVGAPLPNGSTLFGQHGVELCGTMFGLGVLRHRLFEASFSVAAPLHRPHVGTFYSPAGHGDPNWRHREEHPEMHGLGYADRCREAMGIDWMNRDELSQAIPPAYTEFIGSQLLACLGSTV